MTWILAAVCSALMAGSTSVLGKCGVKKTDSDVATALRIVVVFCFPGRWFFSPLPEGALQSFRGAPFCF